MAGERIIVVDADGPARAALADRLAALGYRLNQTSSGKDALTGGGDLLLLAGTPSDMTAIALCEAGCGLVAGRVLALAEDESVATAFAALGAATLLKPVRIAELEHAVRSALREAAPADMILGPLTLDPATRGLEDRAGKSVRLTEKEVAILVYLFGAGGRVVPRDELLAQVWGYAGAADTHTLETHIYRLRRKVSSFATPPDLIGEAGGYRLAFAAQDLPSNDP